MSQDTGMGGSALHGAIAELEARRMQIDDAITALRRLNDAGVVAAAPVAVADRLRRLPVAGRKGEKYAQQAAQVRALYERGVETKDIEKQTGVKVATIYYRAKVGKWKRGKPAATPKGETLPGKVRCPSCELWTEHDPCSSCGKKVRK